MSNLSDNLNEINEKPESHLATEPQELLAETHLPPHEVHIIGGRSGAGKTHLVYQILDRYRHQFEPILYIAGDRPSKHYRKLFKKLGIKPWPVVSLIDEDARLMTGQVIEMVERYQRCFLWLDDFIQGMETKPKVIILDPAQRFIPCKNLNYPASAANGFAALMSWAIKNQITVILVWHVNKVRRNDLNDVFDRLTGSHGVQGHTSTKAFLDVPGPEEKQDKTIHLYLRGQHFQDLRIKLLRGDKGAFRLASAEDEISLQYPVYRILPETPTQREKIIALVKKADNSLKNLSESTIDRQLTALVKGSYAVRLGHGIYQKKRPGVSIKPSSFSQ